MNRLTRLARLGIRGDQQVSAREATSPKLISSANAAARGQFALAALIFVLLSTGLFAAVFEWGHYLERAAPAAGRIARRDRCVVLWIVWWKSLALFVPVLLVGGLLAWRWHVRAATWWLLLAWIGVFFWLAADLCVQHMVGNHAADFLPYIVDAARMPFSAQHAEWWGNSSRTLFALALMLVAVAAAGFLGWKICRAAVALCARRMPILARWPGWVSAGGVLAAILMGVAPMQLIATRPLLLRAVKANLPVSMAAWDRVGSSCLVWLGMGTSSRRVCIVSLLANPAGRDLGQEQVHLHNFSRADVALGNWHLENGRGQHFPLAGALSPGETRVIVIADAAMPLRNQGDTIRLYDGVGQEVHRVSYDRLQAKYGRLLNFRDEDTYGEFESRLNLAAQASYRDVLPRMLESQPVDPAAAFQRADAPNVILLVLESLRHDAISPEMMSRLDAWGGRGLRPRRHYAGANSSHLGLFTMLYGRSPMAYDATLDARVPPQLPISLKRSGYETIFLTSGNCQGFRRMSEYLSEEAFDHRITDGGEAWQDWPLRDGRVLAQVRRLATEPVGRPRFLMAFLMSTHFPYSFPAEFAQRQPCGEGIDYTNWKLADPKVLRNRYHNAAKYLESELMRLIESLDPRRNLIIVTGDHGESFGEDGALAHGSRGSDIQMRVPFLMVGPGVAPASLDRATTHMDLLPTVLHALAGRPVPVAHGGGRDLLAQDNSADDAVLLCPHRWMPPFELVLIRGPDRMQFNYRLDAPEMAAFGFCDEQGALELNHDRDCSPKAAAAWAETMRRELERVAR